MKILSTLLAATLWVVLILGILRFFQVSTHKRRTRTPPALTRYRALVGLLRDARMRNDLPEEDRIEDLLLELWEELSPAERAHTETFAAEAFPPKDLQ